MTTYDHILTEPLTRRGMIALFSVAVTTPMSSQAHAHAYATWCDRLARRAAQAHVVWMPAAGGAMTFADIPTKQLEQLLLRIVEEIPVFPGAVCPRPTLTSNRTRRPTPEE